MEESKKKRSQKKKKKKKEEVSTGKGNHISRESVFNRIGVFVCLLFDVKWEAKTNFKLLE